MLDTLDTFLTTEVILTIVVTVVLIALAATAFVFLERLHDSWASLQQRLPNIDWTEKKGEGDEH